MRFTPFPLLALLAVIPALVSGLPQGTPGDVLGSKEVEDASGSKEVDHMISRLTDLSVGVNNVACVTLSYSRPTMTTDLLRFQRQRPQVLGF